jgi:phosphoserine phosphatase
MRSAVSRSLLTGAAMMLATQEAQTQVLPSWNDGPARQAIVEFVTRVTDSGGPDFVRPADRIATFDNDGTLWPENPVPFEVAFIFDQIKRDAVRHTDWKDRQPYKSVLEDDLHGLIAQGRDAVAQLFMATHAGMTTEAFDQTARDWIAVAKHPRFDRRYAELAYQPMLELLDYLRAHDFKIFIVSGGGAEFMRVFAEKLYGIPPERVIGTLFKTKYEMRNGLPTLSILPELAHWDDREGKARAIHQIIGRRPIAAFGNSDGDQQMLQLTTIGRKPSFGLIVHHTDAGREYAYDSHPKSTGKLVDALAEGQSRGWTIVDMKRDWKRVFSFGD